MSVLPNQSSLNPQKTLFLKIDASLINTSTLNANYISTNKLYADEAIFSSIKGNIDFGSTFTTSNIVASTITANVANLSTAYISTLLANNIYFSSITANNAYI